MAFDRLPKGSTILVTGATGFLGSAVTDLLVSLDYKVKGVTRDLAKAQLFKDALDAKYGTGKIEFVVVTDMTAEGAYDEVLKGTDGVIHLATDASLGTDYNVVVKGVESAVKHILASAAKVPSIKSFVLTASRVSAFHPEKGKDVVVTKDTWADYFIPLAQATDPKSPTAPIIMYAASKVAGERAAWEFVNETKPAYAFNSVLPDYVLGPVLNPTPGVYSTHTFLNELFQSKKDQRAILFMDPAAHAVDSRDVAAVHVAALLSSTTNHQRLWAAPHSFTIDSILAIWRKAFPEREFVPDFKLEGQPKYTIPQDDSLELIKGLLGRGWIPFEESVVANVQDVL